MSKDCSQHVEAIGKGIWLIIPLNGAKAGNGTGSFQNKRQYQLCYTHRQYFESFGNLSVFYPNLTITVGQKSI